MGGYDAGPGFGDFGLGLAARYRAAEALGFEIAWQHHDQTWSPESERVNQPLSASVELFGFPWAKVNPYVLAGVTWTNRVYNDEYFDGFSTVYVCTEDALFGPHGGLGIELAVGKKASVNFEARAIGYVNKPVEDPTIPAALQGNMGFNFYF